MKPDKFPFYNHVSYRALLSEYILYRKRNGQVFSYRWYSQQAGYSAPNFLKLIIDGSRNLTLDGIERLLRVFKWKEPEKNYFRLLVSYEQCKDQRRKIQLADEIEKIRSTKNFKLLKNKEFEYYNKWYHVPLRELILCSPTALSREQLANRLRPKITTAQVNRGLQILEELGLIKKTDNWFEVTDKQISSGDEITNEAITNYHVATIELARESIARFSAAKREVSSSTLALTPEKMKTARSLIQEFHRKLFELETDESGREVFQFNFQMFPLTEKEK